MVLGRSIDGAGTERGEGEQVNPTTCQRCASPSRIALVGERWICAACAPPVPCSKCGEPAKAIGVERFAVGRASDNAVYDMRQAMVYACGAHERRYLTFGPSHDGPGTRKPPQVYDALHVYVDGVLLTEGKA